LFYIYFEFLMVDKSTESIIPRLEIAVVLRAFNFGLIFHILIFVKTSLCCKSWPLLCRSYATPASVQFQEVSTRNLTLSIMVSSGMLRRLALVRTDVSEELSASFIGVTRIGEVGTTLAVTSNRRTLRRKVRRLLVTASVVPSSPILVTLMMEAQNSCETSALTRARRRNLPEDTTLHSHRHENLKAYI
jgi:hypothetical protein